MWGCFLMSGVKILHFFERLMEIHSNSPKLYYGFKHMQKKKVACVKKEKMQWNHKGCIIKNHNNYSAYKLYCTPQIGSAAIT